MLRTQAGDRPASRRVQPGTLCRECDFVVSRGKAHVASCQKALRILRSPQAAPVCRPRSHGGRGGDCLFRRQARSAGPATASSSGLRLATVAGLEFDPDVTQLRHEAADPGTKLDASEHPQGSELHVGAQLRYLSGSRSRPCSGQLRLLPPRP